MIKPKVAVLMSTYNGEKYLREQIDSILQQEDVYLNLFIRDDGSNDKTLDIISDYIHQNHNIILMNSKENFGPAKSFMELFEFAFKYNHKYDYFAFADQDDIWLKDKLSRSISFMKSKATPCLYCSNQFLFVKGDNVGYRHKEEPKLDFFSHLIKNEISGCTMVFNAKLANALYNVGCPPRNILDYRLHDSWLYYVACIYGEVIYDSDSRILYRIHDNNFCGIKKISFWQRIKRRYFSDNPAKKLRSKTAKELLLRCEFKNPDDKKLVEVFANYQNSLYDKKQLLKYSDFICCRSGERKVVLLLKILFNVF